MPIRVRLVRRRPVKVVEKGRDQTVAALSAAAVETGADSDTSAASETNQDN
jgi:hypothetical protein